MTVQRVRPLPCSPPYARYDDRSPKMLPMSTSADVSSCPNAARWRHDNISSRAIGLILTGCWRKVTASPNSCCRTTPPMRQTAALCSRMRTTPRRPLQRFRHRKHLPRHHRVRGRSPAGPPLDPLLQRPLPARRTMAFDANPTCPVDVPRALSGDGGASSTHHRRSPHPTQPDRAARLGMVTSIAFCAAAREARDGKGLRWASNRCSNCARL
jgi:hypothetical protein